MDFVTWLFDTRAGVAAIFIGGIALCLLIAFILERRTKRMYFDHPKGDGEDDGIFSGIFGGEAAAAAQRPSWGPCRGMPRCGPLSRLNPCQRRLRHGSLGKSGTPTRRFHAKGSSGMGRRGSAGGGPMPEAAIGMGKGAS